MYYVKHTDTDAKLIHWYGPFDKATAEAKAEHLIQRGHKAEVVARTDIKH